MSVICYMCISSVVFMQSPTASLILSHPYIARQSRCLRSLFCPLLTLMMTHCSILLRRRTYAVLILHRHMQGREIWYSLTLSTVGSHDPFGCFHFSCLQILSFRCSCFSFRVCWYLVFQHIMDTKYHLCRYLQIKLSLLDV